MRQKSTYKPCFEYPALRARLIERGLTLRSFALTHGYSIPTTYMAARGDRRGIIATHIRKHLEKICHE